MTPLPNYFKPYIDGLPAVPIFLAIALVIAIANWIGDVFEARKADKWPTVVGTVTHSGIQNGCDLRKACCPSITYSYAVGGQSYIGYRTRVGLPDCGEYEAVKNMLAKYAVGTSVTVWFNPQRPDDSALIVGEVSENTWLNIYRCSFVVVIAILLAWWLIYIRTRVKYFDVK